MSQVICILRWADTCASYVHPVFNHVTPYRYILPTVYLFVEDIANPDLFVCVVVGPGFVSISSAFMKSRANHTSWPACPKDGKSGPMGRRFLHNLHSSLP